MKKNTIEPVTDAIKAAQAIEAKAAALAAAKVAAKIAKVREDFGPRYQQVRLLEQAGETKLATALRKEVNRQYAKAMAAANN